MCLSLPVKIISLTSDGQGKVLINQQPRLISLLALKDKIKIGDWVLVQANLAVEKISVKESEAISLLLNTKSKH